MRVHLVDGTLELFRCFFGAPRAQDQDGREIGASRGLLATLVSLLRKEEATHVAVAFDSVVDVVRPGRPRQPLLGPGVDPELRQQYPLATEVVRALGMVVWPMVRFQADDALATGAARFQSQADQVVICTTDKDLSQCVRGERVVVRDRIRKVTWDETGVRKKFGVAPQQIPDLFALVGDPSDGLPGVPGFGPKTAAALLRAFGRLEEIPASPTGWPGVRGAERLARTLVQHRDEALLCRNLAVLHTEVPLPQKLDDLAWRGAWPDLLEPLCERLQTPEILERVSLFRGAPTDAG